MLNFLRFFFITIVQYRAKCKSSTVLNTKCINFFKDDIAIEVFHRVPRKVFH
jgi:hypothetical protein